MRLQVPIAGSALGELQLDAAVLAAGFRRCRRRRAAGTRRSRRPPAGWPARRSAIRNFTTEVARAADSSQLSRIAAAWPDSGTLSVWPSTRSTQLISGGISCCSSMMRGGELLHLDPAGIGLIIVGARREQHFRLEDEAVADDADVLAVGQDLAQAAEEVGAVAVQLLHALRQRHVQAAAEIGDLGVGLAVRVLRTPRAPPRARRSGCAAPRSAG